MEVPEPDEGATQAGKTSDQKAEPPSLASPQLRELRNEMGIVQIRIASLHDEAEVGAVPRKSRGYCHCSRRVSSSEQGGNKMIIHFLGTGAAEGIPSFGCTCQRCQIARTQEGYNARKRASLLVEADSYWILLDTPPEIGLQLNQAGVFDLAAILLSHEHYDHIGGLTDFEYSNQVLPVFVGNDVLPQLRLPPRLQERALLSGFHAHTWLHFGKLRIMPFKVVHHVPCYGFVFEHEDSRIVHFTDSSPELGILHRQLAEQADMVIFHTPTFERHPHHTSVKEVISLVQEWALHRTVLTHINHNNLSHEELNEQVAPLEITVAYDGLALQI